MNHMKKLNILCKLNLKILHITLHRVLLLHSHGLILKKNLKGYPTYISIPATKDYFRDFQEAGLTIL